MQSFVATRKFAIDAAHRVSTHGSKCKNIHGHRYEIEASCEAGGGVLRQQGHQMDMVVDFSFLKEEMINHIETPCDHGMIASLHDIELLKTFCAEGQAFEKWHQKLETDIIKTGFALTEDTRMQTKLYVIAFQPTAERLAEHWFNRLALPVEERSQQRARLQRIRVWETPNCYADYCAPDTL